jgi:phosphate transport system permease protein
LQTDPHTKKRNAAEKRFRMYGLSAIGIAIFALVILLVSIIGNGASSFRQTYLSFPVTINAAEIEAAESALLKTGAYNKIIQTSLLTYLTETALLQDTPEADAFGMISGEAGATFRRFILANPDAAGTTFQMNLLANGRIDGYFKGRVTAQTALLDKNVTPEQLILADRLADHGALVKRFNWAFFTNPDASDQRPEAAGLGVAPGELDDLGAFLAALRAPSPPEGMRDVLSRWPMLKAALATRPKFITKAPVQKL